MTFVFATNKVVGVITCGIFAVLHVIHMMFVADIARCLERFSPLTSLGGKSGRLSRAGLQGHIRPQEQEPLYTLTLDWEVGAESVTEPVLAIPFALRTITASSKNDGSCPALVGYKVTGSSLASYPVTASCLWFQSLSVQPDIYTTNNATWCNADNCCDCMNFISQQMHIKKETI